MKISEQSQNDHHLISPTAKIIAFFRSFSDIGNSKEISDDVAGEVISATVFSEDLDLLTRINAPILEARYKCFDKYIPQYLRFMEIAVGASVERGHRITHNIPSRSYVGADLPGVISTSKALFSSYYETRSNHHLIPANVLSMAQLDAAVDLLGDGEVMILNEGLWMHLSLEEQIAGANNIRRILERRGGIWVTPDFTDQEHLRSAMRTLPSGERMATERVRLAMKDLTRRDLVSYVPKNTDELHDFFKLAKLRAEEVPMVDGAMRLASIEAIFGTSPYPYEDYINSQRLWVIRPV